MIRGRGLVVSFLALLAAGTLAHAFPHQGFVPVLGAAAGLRGAGGSAPRLRRAAMDASAGGSAGGSGPRVTKQTRSTKWFYQQRFLGVGAAADARLNRLAEVAAERWDSFRGASGSGSGILDSSQFGHHVGADTFKNPRTQAMFEAFGIKERSEDIRTLIFAACTGNRQMRGLLCGQILDLANADHSLNLNGILNAAIRDGNEAACDAVVDAAAEVCSRDIVATMNSHTGPVNGADGARAWTPALPPLKGLERVNRLIVGIMTRGLHAPRSFRTANWILDQEIKIKRTASLILEMIMHRIRPAGPRAWCRAQAALAILTFGMLTARMHDFFATLSLTDTYLTVRGTADEAAGKLDESIGLLTQDKRLAWSRAELQKEQAKVSTKPKSKTKADKEEQRGQAAATAQAKPELDLNSLLAAAARFDKSIPIKAQYIAGGQVQTVMA